MNRRPPIPTARRGMTRGVRGVSASVVKRTASPAKGATSAASGSTARGSGRGATAPRTVAKLPAQSSSLKPEVRKKEGNGPGAKSTAGEFKPPPSRKISTPTRMEIKPDDTALDAWDASEIKVVSGSNAAPAARLQFETTQLPHLQTVSKPALTDTSMWMTRVEEEAGEVSDLDVELAWCRMVQAQYLEHLTDKALKKVEEEGEKELLKAWQMVENVRQQYFRSEEERQKLEVVLQIQKNLKGLNESLDLLLTDRDQFTSRIVSLSNELDKLKHYLEVKGITLESDVNHMEKISACLSQFLDQISDQVTSIVAQKEPTSQMLEASLMVKGSSEECVTLAEECAQLLESTYMLALRELSHNISHLQLADAERASTQG